MQKMVQSGKYKQPSLERAAFVKPVYQKILSSKITRNILSVFFDVVIPEWIVPDGNNRIVDKILFEVVRLINFDRFLLLYDQMYIR